MIRRRRRRHAKPIPEAPLVLDARFRRQLEVAVASPPNHVPQARRLTADEVQAAFPNAAISPSYGENYATSATAPMKGRRKRSNSREIWW